MFHAKYQLMIKKSRFQVQCFITLHLSCKNLLSPTDIRLFTSGARRKSVDASSTFTEEACSAWKMLRGRERDEERGRERKKRRKAVFFRNLLNLALHRVCTDRYRSSFHCLSTLLKFHQCHHTEGGLWQANTESLRYPQSDP